MNPLPHDFKVDTAEIGNLLSSHHILSATHNLVSRIKRNVFFSTDSRNTSESCGFIAYSGVANDGHKFIASAIRANAAFIICEIETVDPKSHSVPVFVVKSGRAAWSVLAAHASGNPQNKMKMLGVTGTNGKTSTAWMTRQLLLHAGEKVAMIGTLGAWIGDQFFETRHTTPDPDAFYPLLAKAVDEGVSVCIMEVSSHAIAQDKLTPVIFSAVAFTSFSRDHLDFHKDENDYWQTKCRLFRSMTAPGRPKFVCSGLPEIPTQSDDDTITIYGISGKKDKFGTSHNRVMVSIENESFSGSQISLNTPSGKYSGKVPFFGAHAIENFTAALLLGSTVNKKIWSSVTWNLVEQIPGRLEKIAGENGIVAFVDYAHTPDALEKTLLFLEKYKKSKISVVFGCGGDRDAGKRPLMGKIAAGIADRIYVTSDNPRTENPDQIITDILSGISPRDKVTVQPDRRLAIQSAVSDSSPDDIILIAGKGHETYQIIGDKILPFDDREVVREFLNPK